jgi:gluconate kinase
MLVKVEGTNMYRDTNSMALVNRDTAGREEYFLKRKLVETQKQEINKLKEDFNNIKTEISEIKQLMLKLLEKN